MSNDIAIKVENVSKTFRLPHEKNSSIKSAVINFYRSRRTFEKQEALKNVSFEVKKGEFFGIVGRNGSGKSTLLKMLAGIYSPSKGNIHVNGKLTPFIELGVGFSPELTGRENVFLNGALLGFNRKEMNELYKDIVEFAELERFMDQKLKNYSSGMQVRLAFSIAIRADTDILILDEVLAVGDSSFQKKCLDYFRELKRTKQTVVLVTHDMKTVEKYCDRAMLINDGKLLHVGEARTIAAEYEQLNLVNQSTDLKKVFESHEAKITDVRINGKKDLLIKKPTPITIEITYKALKDVEVAGSMSIALADGTFLANLNMRKDPRLKVTKKNTTKTLICQLGSHQFLDGTYRIDTAIYENDTYLDRLYNAVQFTVSSNKTTSRGGLFNLDGEWQF
jgi:ABC-2 type transport system ATP-binding protein